MMIKAMTLAVLFIQVMLTVDVFPSDGISITKIIDYSGITVDNTRIAFADRCSTDYGYQDLLNNSDNLYLAPVMGH